MKVGSKNRRSGVGLIKMSGRKRFCQCDTDERFSRLYAGNFFVQKRTVFDDVTVTCRNYHLLPDQLVPVLKLFSL